MPESSEPGRPPRLCRLAAVAVAGSLLAAGALAQDGALVESVAIRVDAKMLRSLGPYAEAARELARDVEVSSLTYLSDGLRVKGYVAVPRTGGRLPCVIFNRGGNRSYFALDDGGALLSLGRIASWGYVVVASQYRGNGGGDGQEEFGGVDVNDVLNLIPLLEKHPRADASRLGMIGLSRGGMMTYLALARTDRIAAAVVVGGLSDLPDAGRRRPDMETVYAELVPGYPEEGPGALEERSAIRWVERLPRATALLLQHGAADEKVPPGQALALAGRLVETGHTVRLVLFEGGDHGLTGHTEESFRLTRSWLDAWVRDATRARGPKASAR
jgi:dipeptidyl aminopeptidase/acylaminoacyl peptidase